MSELDQRSVEGTSQADYQPTAYEDSSWEVVGELVDSQEFAPMPVEIMPSTESHTDPMFANYGGIPEDSQAKRWHLPEELLVSERRKVRQDVQEEQVSQIILTEQELADIKAQALEEGRLNGFEEAVSQNNDRMAAIEQQMLGILDDLSKQIKEQQSNIEASAVRLSLAVAEKLTHQAVEINPEYILPIIKHGLGLAATAQVKQIKVSAQDLEFITLMGVNKILKEREDTWEFVADEGIRAGCILETSAGEIDFNLDLAFDRIKNQVLRVVK